MMTIANEGVSETELKFLDQNDLNDLTEWFRQFARTAFPNDSEHALKQFDLFSLTIGLQCLRSGLLQKRIFGIQFLSAQVAMACSSDPRQRYRVPVMQMRSGTTAGPMMVNLRAMTDDEIAQWCIQSQVVEELFGPV
jgi:hypothetical protein